MKNIFAVWVGVLGLLLSASAHAFMVTNAQITDDSGHPIQLNAVNWFGADNAAHVVSGLWSRNWQDMITQMKSNGVNAVRLPLCPATLHGGAVTSVSYSLNPDLQGLNSLQALDKIVAGLDAAGIYILFDFHDSSCSNTLDPLWYTSSYTEAQWISDLTLVAQRYASTPHALGWDIKNEPHGTATWGTGNASTDWNSAAERAAAALLQANPEWLVFVEGIQDNPKDLCQNDPSVIQHFWGENLEPFRCYPLNIPKNKLVLSPHVYGPQTYAQAYFSAANFPNNMPAIYDTVFGYLHDGGYAVVPTEWGGQYNEGYPKEDAFENNWVQYLNSKGMKSAFYWAFNGNGWPNGGLLQTNWSTINPAKEALLQSLWGGSSSGTTSPTPPTPPAAPTATLKLATGTLSANQSTTATWSSTNSTACTASGPGWAAGALGTSGSKATLSFSTAGSYGLTLTCTGAGGSASASATLVVQVTAAPTVKVTLSASQVKTYVHSYATWTTTNATSCVTYGTAWPSGTTLPTSGTAMTYSFALAGGSGYTAGVSCTGPGGTTKSSALLTVVH